MRTINGQEKLELSFVGVTGLVGIGRAVATTIIRRVLFLFSTFSATLLCVYVVVGVIVINSIAIIVVVIIVTVSMDINCIALLISASTSSVVLCVITVFVGR